MIRIGFFVLCLLFLLAGLFSIARGEGQIMVNHLKNFTAGNHTSDFLQVALVTSERTRLQILVTKQNEIIEYHRLVLGPEGVCEGRFKGARSWGYILPEGNKGKDLKVAIFVHTLAGDAGPIFYQIRPRSGEDTAGFHLTTAQIR
ncbi:MAG: hypothetical protein PVH82_09925 [Desulfobacteraceae bacterium]|jgi:hypothetical protein